MMKFKIFYIGLFFIILSTILVHSQTKQQQDNRWNSSKTVNSRVRPVHSQQRNAPYYARQRTKQKSYQQQNVRLQSVGLKDKSIEKDDSAKKQQAKVTPFSNYYQRQNDGLQSVGSQYNPKNETTEKNVSPELKTVELVVSGEGSTKEEATKVALRSAIEQAFGAFVSSNTDVLNDDIVKDEIATISSGNIQSYKELSTVDLGETKVVNIEAVVSIGKLLSFAKSKGMRAELDGATFAMNMKMKELNKANESIAISNMTKQLLMIGLNNNLYDFEIDLSEPRQSNHPDYYYIIADVKVVPNENAKIFSDVYLKTMKSLALTASEMREYENANVSYFGRLANMGGYPTDDGYINSFILRNNTYTNYSIDEIKKNPYLSFATIQFAFVCSKYKFKIVDNIGNEIVISCKKNYDEVSFENDYNNFNIVKRYDLVAFGGYHWGADNTDRNDIVFVTPKRLPNLEIRVSGAESRLLDWSGLNTIYKLNNQYKVDGKVYYESSGLEYYFYKQILDSRGLNSSHLEEEEITFRLYYSKEDFSKLSSIDIKPVSEMLFIE